jgi:hypothetical protein
MPPVPATAEVLPIEMDGIFELKVEVVGPNRQKQPTGKPTSGERRTDRLVGEARIPQHVASRSAGRKVRSKQLRRWERELRSHLSLLLNYLIIQCHDLASFDVFST